MNDNVNLPLVTVITPAYNRSSYLDETITSVLGQDYPNIEYIVLDDGSTDETLAVIKSYSDRIVWSSHPNIGETRTVNKGFSMAHGDIIGVVNSDDPLLPGAVSRIVQHFIERSDLLVAYPDWLMIDENGAVIQSVATYEYNYANMVRRHHCLPGPGTFFRLEVLEKLGGRDPQFRYVADFDFWIRAGLLGTFKRVPEKLATFRVHSDSASVNQMGKAMAEEHFRLIEKLYSFSELPVAIRRLKRQAYSSAYFVAGCLCGPGLLLRRKRYFIYAVLLDPMNYLGEYRRDRTWYMFPALMQGLYVPYVFVVRCFMKVINLIKATACICLP
jgi:glycosyltransferase involved in cell wall biosynthesis